MPLNAPPWRCRGAGTAGQQAFSGLIAGWAWRGPRETRGRAADLTGQYRFRLGREGGGVDAGGACPAVDCMVGAGQGTPAAVPPALTRHRTAQPFPNVSLVPPGLPWAAGAPGERLRASLGAGSVRRRRGGQVPSVPPQVRITAMFCGNSSLLHGNPGPGTPHALRGTSAAKCRARRPLCVSVPPAGLDVVSLFISSYLRYASPVSR